MILIENPIPRDWFDWSNAGVGLVGLALTLWAVWQAKGAKEAAQLAGTRIRQHNAEVDFSALARIAKELHGYVEDSRMSEARLRTTDLRLELATAMRSHAQFVAHEAGRLQEKQIDLKLITEGLNGGPESLSSTEKIRLLRITGEILEALAGLSGQFRARADKEVSNV
jgi:hypothetical protein